MAASAGLGDAIERALNTLTNAGPQACQEIDRRITQLEAEIKRLRTLRKTLAKACGAPAPESATPKPTPPTGLEIENRIVEVLTTEKGGMTCSQIANALGNVGFVAIGQTVAKSTKLRKDGPYVFLKK